MAQTLADYGPSPVEYGPKPVEHEPDFDRIQPKLGRPRRNMTISAQFWLRRSPGRLRGPAVDKGGGRGTPRPRQGSKVTNAH